jgi:long-chain acyl-CoA synthetase
LRQSLLDYFHDFSQHNGDFLVYDNGYRSWHYSYGQVAGAAQAFAERLRLQGCKRGDKLILWCENRPEWVVALWGCLLEGVVAVPIDFRSSPEFVRRIHGIVQARGVFAGLEVDVAGFDVVWRADSIEWQGAGSSTHQAQATDLAEIIFTSGATSEPKGVTITHRNILANVVPVETELKKYKRYARPFAPIRFLNLLPLSHMFGQVMATFIPPLLPGVVVFMHGFNPRDIVHQIRRRRISVLVSVPKILEVLKDYVIHQVPEAAERVPGKSHWVRRWWHYRRVHKLFGFKFWAFIVGAAPLDPELEEFWSHLGFVVIQGYGLTETAPVVTLNHPFHARKGAVGTPIGGVEVRIAEDGEILVRGENVTQGYYGAEQATREAFINGWFHTGDIGELDSEGRLYIRGRKKEMIVTPDGLNVFPEDVERVLNQAPGVREAAVVGRSESGKERVHAVLVMEPGGSADSAVAFANAQLEEHQKVRSVSVWTEGDLPRTEGTRKLKRTAIRKWVESGVIAGASARGDSIEDLLARYAGGRSVNANTTLDDLGLSSLERVELMMEIEERFNRPVDEGRFTGAQTIDALRKQIEEPAAAPVEAVDFPRWNRTWWAGVLRRISLPTWIRLPFLLFAWVRTEGRENLEALKGPVIFAANHQSHFDTPAIFYSLPAKWRYKLAPAMSKEFFKAHFFPEQYGVVERVFTSLYYYLSSLFFNAFPLPQREAGARTTLRYAGELISDGWCILLYPEGKRTDAGEIQRFFPGVAMIASKLNVPVVPIRIEGFEKILHKSATYPTPGRARVIIGKPVSLTGDDYSALASQLEQTIRNLLR